LQTELNDKMYFSYTINEREILARKHQTSDLETP